MDLPVAGIDIAKKSFDVALLIGGKVKRKSCKNTVAGHRELIDWLTRHATGPVHLCLEATSSYGEALALALADAGHTVSIVNPAQIHAFGKSELLRTKTDAVDAELIGRFCAAMHPAPWVPPPPELRELQALVRRLDVLVAMRVDEKLRLDTACLEEVRASVQVHVRHLDQQITELERHIHDHFKQHPDLKAQRDLLTSIPGIAEKTAAVILAELPDVNGFSTARQVAAYSGLAPREHRSGSSIRGKTHLCKIGNNRLRKALYMPAVSAKRCNLAAKHLYARLLAKGKAPMAALGAVMRKLIVWAFGVLKSGRPFDLALATR